MLATITLSGLGVATALKVPFQNFSKSCFSPSCRKLLVAVLPSDPRVWEGPLSPLRLSLSENGVCISRLVFFLSFLICKWDVIFSPSWARRPTVRWKHSHTLSPVVARELSKYWIKASGVQRAALPRPLLFAAAGQRVSASVCSSVELQPGEKDKSWPSPAEGRVLFLKTGRGGGKIVFLSPPLLLSHICCSIWDGVRFGESGELPSFYCHCRKLYTVWSTPVLQMEERGSVRRRQEFSWSEAVFWLYSHPQQLSRFEASVSVGRSVCEFEECVSGCVNESWVRSWTVKKLVLYLCAGDVKRGAGLWGRGTPLCVMWVCCSCLLVLELGLPLILTSMHPCLFL